MMYFKDTITNKQWISGLSDVTKFGERLKFDVMHRGAEVISAGTVMVFAWSGKPYMMFQMLQDLVLSSARNSTLLYYEKGSIVFFRREWEFIPTLRFHDCRFPTENELRYYERRATI